MLYCHRSECHSTIKKSQHFLSPTVYGNIFRMFITFWCLIHCFFIRATPIIIYRHNMIYIKNERNYYFIRFPYFLFTMNLFSFLFIWITPCNFLLFYNCLFLRSYKEVDRCQMHAKHRSFFKNKSRLYVCHSFLLL